VAKHQRVQPKRQHPKPKRRHPKPAPASRATLVFQPEPTRSEIVAPSLVPVAASQTISLPSALEVFLALMIGVSVLVAALAVVPRRVLQQPVLRELGGQREHLLFVAFALVVFAGLVLLMYLLAAS
jgi:hypothetical protein